MKRENQEKKGELMLSVNPKKMSLISFIFLGIVSQCWIVDFNILIIHFCISFSCTFSQVYLQI